MLRRSSLIAAVVASLATAIAAQSRPPMTEILDTYSQGRLRRGRPRRRPPSTTSARCACSLCRTSGWISSDPALATEAGAPPPRRSSLELTHARLETDWGRLSDLIEFTCAQPCAPPARHRLELAWHRASIALASRARARLWLLGEYAPAAASDRRAAAGHEKQTRSPRRI